MVTRTSSVVPTEDRRAGRRADWLADSVVSGFVATVAMTAIMALAYGVARAIGDEQGTTVERWFWALTHNPVTRTTQDAIGLAIARLEELAEEFRADPLLHSLVTGRAN